jgi:hypothetical protein
MLSSSRPSVGALIAETLDQLAYGASRRDYSYFDESLQHLRALRRGGALGGPIEVNLQDISSSFEEFRCSLPREDDINHYKLFRIASTYRSGPSFPQAAEPLEDLVTRVRSFVSELQAIKQQLGTVFPDPGISRVFCGLLAFHLRHGNPDPRTLIADGKQLMTSAQILQDSLDDRLSPEFKVQEARWAAYTSDGVSSRDIESTLAKSSRLFRIDYKESMKEMDLYVRKVHASVQSFPGAGVPGNLPLTGANAYRYAFLVGLIDQDRLSRILRVEGETQWVNQIDEEALRLGALALSRISSEYATVQALAPRSDRGPDRWDTQDSVDTLALGDDGNFGGDTFLIERAQIFQEDYWNIAGPLLAARAFRKNPCAEGRLEDSAILTTPYLAGIQYLTTFVRAAHRASCR